MIIYLYLTLIIVFSILTGIITTIIEKKGLKADTSHNSVVKSTSLPSRVSRSVRHNNNPVIIPVVKPDSDLAKTIQLSNVTNNHFSQQNNYMSSATHQSDPIILGIVDEEII